MRPFTGQITTKGLPPHTYCVRSPRGIKQPVFYSWTRWQNFSVFLGHHILQASGGESTNQAHTVEVGMGLPTRGGILQLMGSWTENHASAEAPSVTEVLGKASYCHHTVEPNTSPAECL